MSEWVEWNKVDENRMRYFWVSLFFLNIARNFAFKNIHTRISIWNTFHFSNFLFQFGTKIKFHFMNENKIPFDIEMKVVAHDDSLGEYNDAYSYPCPLWLTQFYNFHSRIM